MNYFDSDAKPTEDGDGEGAPAANDAMAIGELAALLSGEIEAARETERTSYKDDRQRRARCPTGPPPAGRSAAMSRDVADTVDWMLPGLMRIFFSGDKIVD